MIAWFVRNPVAANILMLAILGAGIYAATRTPVEVFPSVDEDLVRISVRVPGASPADVEAAVLLPVENAVANLPGAGGIVARAQEGWGEIEVAAADGYDARRLLEDVKARVDALTDLPAGAEPPVYQISRNVFEVISVVLFGPFEEIELRRLGERVRDDLLAMPEVARALLEPARSFEISVQVSETTLERYGLSFSGIADAIRNGSVDLSAGTLRSGGSEVLLRTRTQAYEAGDLASIIVRTHEEGALVRLGDVARITDGFDSDRVETRYNDSPAMVVTVHLVGRKSVIDIAEQVRNYLADAGRWLPADASMLVWRDQSQTITSHLNTLVSNAWLGGLLILILLTVFLRFRFAFWVAIGIPVSFAGALMLMPILGLSLNSLTLVAFILVLGLVVDDAIVTGENIDRHLQRETDGDTQGVVVRGTQEIAVPVTFGVLTTMVAFAPLLFIGGSSGELYLQVPAVAIPVLLFSLIESKLVLPAHLQRIGQPRGDGAFEHVRRRFGDALEARMHRAYRPLIAQAIERPYLAAMVFIGAAMILLASLVGGRIPLVFFPPIESEIAHATLTMPPGTPFETTREHIQEIAQEADALRSRYGGKGEDGDLIGGILATVGSSLGSERPSGNKGEVTFLIAGPHERARDISSDRIVEEWREAVGSIPGAESLHFRTGVRIGGEPVHIELAGSDTALLAEVAEQVKVRLRGYPGVYQVSDSFERGKEELEIAVLPSAERLGISPSLLARQVRQAFLGEEVQRFQRGQDEVRVILRYPPSKRRSIEDLQNLRVRTPDDLLVPLGEVASLKPGRGEHEVLRVDRRRVVNVTASVDEAQADAASVRRDLATWLDAQQHQWPSLRWGFEGEAAEQRETSSSLAIGLVFLLFAIYALLAIPLRSYLQPLIVMSVLPFGAIGALLGHVILGMPVSVSSLVGMLALSGVVVNDSLMLVAAANSQRAAGAGLIDAIQLASASRLRAVLLTSVTTFVGLLPLILDNPPGETQFLIPMAVSIGFGVLFATAITLVLVPVVYLMLERMKASLMRQ